MPEYSIVYSKHLVKDLKTLPRNVVDNILLEIGKLIHNPRPTGVKKLKGYKDVYRIWYGNYRILYSIFDKQLIIEVIKVGDRKNIYE